MIVAKGLTKKFDGVAALDGLSLQVEEGEIFGLVGPDGAGKTTTMRLLTSIMDPDAGEASVAGHDVVREAEAVKAEIGYMSQRFGLYADLTVMENLNFYADIYNVPRKGRDERVQRLLAFSNLTPFKRRLAGNLSGGMKQKLGLACTLVHTPRVLFLDEPTNGVNPVSRRDFWRILYQLLRERRDDLRLHGLSRRSRALQPAGVDPSRPNDRLRHAGRSQTIDEGDNSSRSARLSLAVRP